MGLENCPKCQEKLTISFSSNNRQICSYCGWIQSSDTRKSKLINKQNIASNYDKPTFIEYIYEKLNSNSTPQKNSSKTKLNSLIWSNIFVVLANFCLSLIQITDLRMTLGFLIGVLIANIYIPSLAVAVSQLIKQFRNSRARRTIFLLFSLYMFCSEIYVLLFL